LPIEERFSAIGTSTGFQVRIMHRALFWLGIPIILSASPSTQQPITAPKRILMPVATGYGWIAGEVSYPSDYLPDDLRVTAAPVRGGRLYSTTRRKGAKYQLSLPAGEYYVYATTKATPTLTGYKAYYTEFTTCGSSVDCPSHKKIVVRVRSKTGTYHIDPQDWYDWPKNDSEEH
jgi:hypothetical protein